VTSPVTSATTPPAIPSAGAYIGISGWRYAPWRGSFYPKGLQQRRELEHASGVLSSIEINGSFYSLQRPESYVAWAAQTPPGFVFSVKGPRFITHMKKLADVQTPLANFFASGVLALGPKLGPILWQLPPTFRRDDERLDAWLEAVRRYPPALHAVEFRHESWFVPEVYGILHAHGAALAIGDDPRRVAVPHVVTTEWSFVRLHHGHRGRRGNYSETELQEWAQRLRDLARTGPVYVYFNNDWEGFAVANGKRLKRLLDQ
jgi:uncharacterized protein YecE (DUF72 family)